MSRPFALAAAALALAATPAAAQKPYAVPESPAFTYLNVTPAQVSRPTTARAFATALLNGVSPSGELQQGVALDVAPWSFVPGLRIPLDRYQKSGGAYALANTQLSLASVRAAGDSGATDVAAGLRVTFVDHSDPMRDTAFTNGLGRLLTACLPDQPGPAAATQADACASEAAQKWRDTWLNEHGHWNDAGLAAGLAGGWRMDASRLGHGEWRGLGVWATGAIPLGRGGQALAQLRYDGAAEDSTRGLSFGGRALYGSASVNAFVEVARGPRGGTDFRGAQWTGGLEFRAADNLWLSTGFGSRGTPGGDGTRGVLIADLRWQVSDAPRLAPSH